MLKSKNLPNDYWAEAMEIVVYILNHSPIKPVKNITPKKAWSGHKPSVTHFRVFSYVAYVHILDKKRKKLDAKSELCIFMGYSEETKGYRFYNPMTKQLIISRDVLFNEGGEGVQQKKPVIEKIEDDITPPPPTSSSGSSSSPNSPSSGGSSISPSRTTQSSPSASLALSESPPRKVRNLNDI
eukprot:Gb_33365 [translate_table: standard]